MLIANQPRNELAKQRKNISSLLFVFCVLDQSAFIFLFIICVSMCVCVCVLVVAEERREKERDRNLIFILFRPHEGKKTKKIAGQDVFYLLSLKKKGGGGGQINLFDAHSFAKFI